MRRSNILLAIAVVALACCSQALLAQANNAQAVSSTIPDTMIPSYSYNVAVTMKNTGTSTWTKANSYRLGPASSNPFNGPGRIDLADTDAIAPGQQKTFTFTLTAGSEGTFTTDWRMLRENVEWFGEVLAKQVSVTFGPNPPGVPTIDDPPAMAEIGTNRPDIRFHGDPFDAYQVQIATSDAPNSNVAWDSGTTYVPKAATDGFVTTPALTPQTTYYVFVRLHNPRGWGQWTGYRHGFYVSAQLVNDPYYIAGDVGGQWQHTICYNPTRNEYLVAYYDMRADTWRKISYYRLDGNGTKIGGETTIYDTMDGSGGPHVAYNSVRQEYLIAYGGYTAAGGLHDELHIQRINAVTGALIGGSTWITNNPGAFDMQIAYSPTSDNYLLIWDSDYDIPCQLDGLRLSSTGAPIGSIFHVSTGGYRWAGNSSICYNSTNNEFFITWQAYFEPDNNGTGWDTFGRRVRASDGALLGSELAISTGLSETNGGVTYDSNMNRYMLIYQASNGSPLGQFITASGTLDGPSFRIASDYYYGGMASVTWNPVTHEYLATWAHQNSAGNFARRFTQTGVPIGEPARTNGNITGIGNWDPVAVTNTSNGEFLICWFCGYDNVFVRRLRTFPGLPVDTTPPASVAGFTATSGDTQLTLNWTNPSTSDFTGTMIVYRTGAYPMTVDEGTALGDFLASPGSTGSAAVTGLTNGVTYYFSAFSHDFANYGQKTLASGVPADVTAPGPVTALTATAAGQSINLAWTNPSDVDYTGTMIRFKNTGYPSSKTDGYLLSYEVNTPGSNDTYVHSGVGNATYYYAAFAYDEVPNYSTSATAQATPACMADQWWGDTFDSYADGNLGGQGSWVRTGAADAVVEGAVAKSGKAVLMDTVVAGANIADQASFTAKTSGYYFVTFDVSQDFAGTAAQLGGNVAILASDGTEIGKLHVQKGRMLFEYGTSQFAILTTTAANLTWYAIKIGVNVDAHTLDLWLDTTAKGTGLAWKGGTNLGKITLSSDRNTNLTSQKVYVDNVNVDIRPAQVSSVADDGAWTPSNSKLHFTFEPFACANEYRYAIGTTSGGIEARTWTSCGLSTDVMATGLSLADNQTYYVSVQIGTGHGTWGVSRTSDGIRVAPAVSIQGAKALADGTTANTKALRGKLVSAVFPGYFYVQEPNQPFGIKIISSEAVLPGDAVDLAGFLQGSALERTLDCTGNPVFKNTGTGTPAPIEVGTAALGGADLNANTHGVVGGVGPNNIGLYVRVCGKVTQLNNSLGTSYFYIDDGSGLRDGTTTPLWGTMGAGSGDDIDNIGVKVQLDPDNPTIYPQDSYVAVTGIVSCFNSSGLRPQLLPVEVQALGL